MSSETTELSVAEEHNLSTSLLKRVYCAASEGMSIALFDLIKNLTAPQINCLINQTVLDEDGRACTPLIAAARYGHNKVVRMLLDKFKPDLEQEGIVKYDGYVFEGATALWCAASVGHLTVVKMLVKAGANVNHLTKTLSSPLRAACFDGRLDIVKYLAEHNADVNVANKFNNTSLMIAAYKGHLDVVKYLLEKGADLNAMADCGATALHFAAEGGHTEIVSTLLSYGAEMKRNVKNRMTPLIVAAERTRDQVVEFFLKRTKVSREKVVEAYELLGASYANDRDNYCIKKVYTYLHKAMKLRYADPKDVLWKKRRKKTVAAYGHRRECETLEELESIAANTDALHMECLIIRERILGPDNPEIPHPIVYHGAIYADSARFDRCIELWLHALKLRQLSGTSLVKDLLRFAQVFSEMIHVGVVLELSPVLKILEASVMELGRNKSKIENPESKEDLKQCIEDMESNVMSTLYILTILTKLLATGERELEEDFVKVLTVVYKLCSLQVRLLDGRTLLHLAVNAETPVDDFHTNNVCKFPCAQTAKILIRCGADVNAMDSKRDTPLHVIVRYRKSMSHFVPLHSIITELVRAGAHMDVVNARGKTPYDVVTTALGEQLLRTHTRLSLECLAAKVVKAHNLPYRGRVPESLEGFIELHGRGLTQG